ncbi:MAG TPA: guanine deaminase [Candidatus Obscuribacterales bacterium]
MASSNGDSQSAGSKLTVYCGHILSPKTFDQYDEYIEGALVVNEQGILVDVGPRSPILSKHKAHETIDFGKCLLLPGFVDLHVHLVQIAQTGRSGDTLLGWLDKYIFPEEMRFKEKPHAQKLARWFFNELAKNGTTLGAVFTSIHSEATDVAFQTAAEFGSRVIMGKTMMDINSPDELTEKTAVSLQQSEALCKKWHGYDSGRLLYAFTPRFAPTCSPDLMNGVSKLWKSQPGTYMQTHLSENLDEIRWVEDLFPKAANYLDVYGSHGLTGSNSLFAHAIHMSDDEISKLVHDDCGVAHCPSSNFFLKSGVFPYARMRKAGVNFGLGSDIAAGPEMSIMGVMKDASYIQPDLWMSPAELFYLSTLGGARAVNLHDKVGSLEPGKEADFIVVDPGAKTSVIADVLDKPAHDILSSLIYVGDDRMVAATYVRGRCIYRSEHLPTVKPAAVSR